MEKNSVRPEDLEKKLKRLEGLLRQVREEVANEDGEEVFVENSNNPLRKLADRSGEASASLSNLDAVFSDTDPNSPTDLEHLLWVLENIYASLEVLPKKEDLFPIN